MAPIMPPHVIFSQFGETTRQTITVNQLDLLPPTQPTHPKNPPTTHLQSQSGTGMPDISWAPPHSLPIR